MAKRYEVVVAKFVSGNWTKDSQTSYGDEGVQPTVSVASGDTTAQISVTLSPTYANKTQILNVKYPYDIDIDAEGFSVSNVTNSGFKIDITRDEPSDIDENHEVEFTIREHLFPQS